MGKITENTLMPLSMVAAIAGSIVWLSMIYFKTEASAKAIDGVLLKQDAYIDTVQEINRRLSVIESEVKRIQEKRR